MLMVRRSGGAAPRTTPQLPPPPPPLVAPPPAHCSARPAARPRRGARRPRPGRPGARRPCTRRPFLGGFWCCCLANRFPSRKKTRVGGGVGWGAGGWRARARCRWLAVCAELVCSLARAREKEREMRSPFIAVRRQPAHSRLIAGAVARAAREERAVPLLQPSLLLARSVRSHSARARKTTTTSTTQQPHQPHHTPAIQQGGKHTSGEPRRRRRRRAPTAPSLHTRARASHGRDFWRPDLGRAPAAPATTAAAIRRPAPAHVRAGRAPAPAAAARQRRQQRLCGRQHPARRAALGQAPGVPQHVFVPPAPGRQRGHHRPHPLQPGGLWRAADPGHHRRRSELYVPDGAALGGRLFGRRRRRLAVLVRLHDRGGFG